MAVVRPLYYDNGNIKQMTDSMITEVVDQTCYQYALDPSVTLTVSASNVDATSHFPTINDTRYKTGAVSSGTGDSVKGVSPADFPSDPENPQLETVQWNRLVKATASVSPTSDSGKTWPVYYNASGDIQAMNITDVKDTILHPAIDKLIVAGSPGDTAAGTYMITTSATPAGGFTVVSGGNILFTDLITSMTWSSAITGGAGDIGRTVTAEAASAAGITTAEIGAAGTYQDDSITRNNYYLHIKDAPSSPSYTDPLFVTSTNDLQTYPSATFKALLQEWIRETASESSDGYQLLYNIDGSGNLRTNMVNAAITGASLTILGGSPRTLQVGDDYRSQDFPAGTLGAINTYTFNITKG